MALYITLLLTTAFISKALTLNCYECIPYSGVVCPVKMNCPSSCGSMTTTVYVDGIKMKSSSSRACTDPAACVTGSMNSGQSKVTLNSQCCNNTNYCNNQNAPDLPPKLLNGKKCFTCNATADCTQTMACEGDETRCFTTTAAVGGKNVTTKGCSSKLFCGNGTVALGVPVQSYGFGANMRCCEGSLCNGAQSVTLYFPVLVSLLSLFVC